MCQIGASNLPETLDLLDHATGAGAATVLVAPPVIRFDLASPRGTWSAKIGIDHFCLIPRRF